MKAALSPLRTSEREHARQRDAAGVVEGGLPAGVLLQPRDHDVAPAAIPEAVGRVQHVTKVQHMWTCWEAQYRSGAHTSSHDASSATVRQSRCGTTHHGCHSETVCEGVAKSTAVKGSCRTVSGTDIEAPVPVFAQPVQTRVRAGPSVWVRRHAEHICLGFCRCVCAASIRPC